MRDGLLGLLPGLAISGIERLHPKQLVLVTGNKEPRNKADYDPIDLKTS
jgi:hypothetical protein